MIIVKGWEFRDGIWNGPLPWNPDGSDSLVRMCAACGEHIRECMGCVVPSDVLPALQGKPLARFPRELCFWCATARARWNPDGSLTRIDGRLWRWEDGTLVKVEKSTKKIKALVHKNLGMSERKVAAQCVHAAIGLYKKDPQEHWSAVVLEASTKKFYEAVEAHPEGYVVADAGYTEVPAGSHTVVAWYEEEDGEDGEP